MLNILHNQSLIKRKGGNTGKQELKGLLHIILVLTKKEKL